MSSQGKLAHWQAVRRAFTADALLRERDAAALTAEQRVLIGLQMGALIPRTASTEAELDAEGLAQAQLHVRYRNLQASRARRPR